jgi:hypothetical protein
MNLFSRFLGRKDVNDLARRRLVANPDIKKPLSLQVLFADPHRLDADRLLNTLKAYHPTMSEARCEIDVELSQQGTLLGMLGWGKHVVRLVGFNAPMPAAAVETCVAPSHYPKELKNVPDPTRRTPFSFMLGTRLRHLTATWPWPPLQVFWRAWARSRCLTSRGIPPFPQWHYPVQTLGATLLITCDRCRCSCSIVVS